MQSKESMMPLFDVIMYAVVCACVALVFFQVDEKKDSIRDRLGLLYFYMIFWDFEPMSSQYKAYARSYQKKGLPKQSPICVLHCKISQ